MRKKERGGRKKTSRYEKNKKKASFPYLNQKKKPAPSPFADLVQKGPTTSLFDDDEDDPDYQLLMNQVSKKLPGSSQQTPSKTSMFDEDDDFDKFFS